MEDLTEQAKENKPATHPAARVYSFAVVIFSAALLFLSLAFLYNPYWTTYYNLGGFVFFFILIPMIPLGYFPFVLIIGFMTALYIAFFYFILRASTKPVKRMIDSPAGYFAVVGPALILVTVVITLIEQSFGVGIGGSSIENQLKSAPFLGYTSLIYAPFAEEIGFRIIPLGLFSFFLVYSKSRNVRDSLYSIVAPGRMRAKYGLKIGWTGLVLILATSVIWGYAHVYYGAWDAGKILTVTITGIGFGFAYLKFGLYLDIPMHWLNNGALTLAAIFPATVGVVAAFTGWIILGGIGGIVLLLVYFAVYISEGGYRQSSSAE